MNGVHLFKILGKNDKFTAVHVLMSLRVILYRLTLLQHNQVIEETKQSCKCLKVYQNLSTVFKYSIYLKERKQRENREWMEM